MKLDKEQEIVLDYILNLGSCYVVGPPGTGKTEIFNALGERWASSAAFLPFTRAARKELSDRLPHLDIKIDGETVKCPAHDISVSTINSFCQSNLDEWPGTYDAQLTKFLESKNKVKYSLVGIDEVQDLRPIHFDVIKSIINGKVFAGGDPNQTIFTFGEALGYKIFPELDKLCKKFELHNDYRSNPSIVSILNNLVSGDIQGLGPKTYNRNAIFARTHNQLGGISKSLKDQGIPHTIRGKNGKDKVVLEENNLFLMVTHACKGLGFDKVYQFDWRLPHHPDVNYQEEYNLMYVSVARASKEFYLVDGNWNTNCWGYLRNTETKMVTNSELHKVL